MAEKSQLSPVPDEKSDLDSDWDPDEDARDAIIPRPPPKRSSVSSGLSGRARSLSVGSELAPLSSHGGRDGQWLSIYSLLQSSSPFVKLDEDRMSALSPSSRASVIAASPKRVKSSRGSAETKRAQAIMSMESLVNMMPVNRNLKMDLRTLNLHLGLRTAEIIACSESMWEWVLECQRKAEQSKRHKNRRRPATAEGTPSRNLGNGPTPTSSDKKAAVLALTREEFEELLVNFDM